MNNQDFKNRIKELRESRGITQEELAKAIDVPSSTIRRYESGNGEPRKERLNKLADFFGVQTDYLLGRTDDTSNSYSQVELKEDEKKFLEIFRELDDKDKSFLSDFMERIQKK